MAPPRETEREVPQPPRFPEAPQDSSDRLRREALGPQERPARGIEQRALQSIHSPNFDNPVDHLERTKIAWRQEGFRGAEREYFAAIRAADRIDQQEVARERDQVKKAMQTEKDPTRRRELVEYDMTLHDMQRAPGFTRANLGLAYLRLGYQAEGVRMLLEAQRLDPEMETDPNFIRHLRSLNAPIPGREGPVAPQPGRPPQGGDRVPQPQPQGGDRVPQPQPQGGDRVPQPQPQGGDRVPQPQPQGGDRVPQPQPQGGDRVPQPQPQGGDRTTQGLPPTQDQVTLPSGNNRPDAQTFDDPLAHIKKANDALVQAKALTPEVKAEYEASIKAADTIDRTYLAQQAQALKGALEKAYPPETQQKVTALEKERDEMLAKLPAETQKKLAELDTKLKQAKTPEEQETIKKEMKAMVPDIAKKQDEIDTQTAQAKAILQQLQAIELLANSSALARFAYANALSQAGDKDSAKQLLDQVRKLDPDAVKEEKFQNLAKDVGYTIPAAAGTPDTTTATKPDATTTTKSGNKPEATTPTQPDTSTATKPGDKVERPAASAGGDASEPDTIDLLAKAHEKEAKEGFAAAKPLYEQAIAAADKIDQKAVAENLKQIEAKLKDTSLDAATKEKLQQLGVLFLIYQNSPDRTRFDLAVAQNNNGDQAGAKATLEAMAKRNPEIAKDASYKAAVAMVEKKEKITEESLKKAVADAGSTGGGNTGSVAENPYTHIQTAADAEKKGNAKTAETEWRAAIVAADKLDMEPYKKKLEEVNAAIKKGSTDPLESQKLTEMKKGLEEVISLPVNLRMQTAQFYLKNAKPDEAKALLDQALQKDASVKEQEGFKQLAQVAQVNSKGTIEKSIDFLKGAGKEILSDGAGGTLGLIAFNLTPGGKVLKLGSALLAGGAGKHGANMLMGVDSTLGHDMAWGSVDALAFVSGAGVRNKLMGKFESSLSKDAIGTILKDGSELGLKNFDAKEAALLGNRNVLKEALAGSLHSEEEKLAARQTLAGSLSRGEKKALESVLAGTSTDVERDLLTKKIGTLGEKHVQLIAERDAFTAQVSALTGADGPHGLKGLEAATQLLTKGVAGAEERAATELSTAIAKAPVWQKPLLWAQGHSPLLWRIPTKSLAGYQELEREALAAHGSKFNFLNPFNSFASVENYSSLRNLEAKTYWNRFKIDSAGVGAGSLVFRAPHEAVKVGTVNPTTGNKYSAYDAITNTAVGTATDALAGGFLVGMGRGMGGFFTKHSGTVGEINPILRPAPLTAESSLYAKVTQPFRWTSYGLKQVPKFFGDQATRAGNWLSSEGAIPGALRKSGTSITTGAAIFSPKLYEGYSGWEKMGEYEKILAEIQKPIVDQHPEKATSDKTVTAPAPADQKPAPAKPEAAKPEAQATAPEQKKDGTDVGSGLPE